MGRRAALRVVAGAHVCRRVGIDVGICGVCADRHWLGCRISTSVASTSRACGSKRFLGNGPGACAHKADQLDWESSVILG